MKLKNEYLYCVAQKSGHLCLWSMATNRQHSWWEFGQRPKELHSPFYKGKSILQIKQEAQKSGHVCVRLKVDAGEARQSEGE